MLRDRNDMAYIYDGAAAERLMVKFSMSTFRN